MVGMSRADESGGQRVGDEAWGKLALRIKNAFGVKRFTLMQIR
jgi:hypothetical protein